LTRRGLRVKARALPYDREIPVELCKKLMQARIDEYEATGADWSDA
jgi:hypothetical protein